MCLAFPLLLLACSLHAQVGGAARSAVPDSSVKAAFVSGERLEYVVRYAFTTWAAIRISTTDTIIAGRRAYHHIIDGRTKGFANTIYPVHDVYHGYADPVSNLPTRAIRNVAEQAYRDYKRDDYDRSTRPDSALVIRETGDTVVLPRLTRDMVSLVFHIRSRLSGMKLVKGQRLEFPLYFNAEYFPFAIRYDGDEVLKTKFGRIKCHRFKPLVRKGSVFVDQEALTIWLSSDSNHIPIRARFELFIGGMQCNLVACKGLSTPLVVQK